jgi:uncharacterized repeat protein (TIGR03803 family)
VIASSLSRISFFLSHTARKRFLATLLVVAALLAGASAQSFNYLTDFNGTNGRYPSFTLTQGIDGKLYGTTTLGGADSLGEAFSVTLSGNVTVLHSFCSQPNCSDGLYPSSPLLLASDGNFYGTAGAGGANGEGTIFRISQSGKFTTIYSFCAQANCADGSGPFGPLLEGSDGNLYGTTLGGPRYCPDGGCGTLYKFSSKGLTNLYTFCVLSNCTDGDVPNGGLIQIGGDFYGTTLAGGTDDEGTVFRISRSGALTTVHSFGTQAGDGYQPLTGLVQASNGNVYGATSLTLFMIDSAGTLTTLESCGGNTCPAETDSALVEATDGSLYGASYEGGLLSGGVIFNLSLAGDFTVLYNFCTGNGCGYNPAGGLTQSTDGTFYGTTGYSYSGGGTIYSLDMGLGPFVAFIRGYGKVGQTVGILGQGFTGTAEVSFNGTPAKFTVVSGAFIEATVPAGASSGYVKVATPDGTLKSNVAFRVIQ